MKRVAGPPSVRLLDLGRSVYCDALAIQREHHAQRKAGMIPDTLIVTEHEPVITTGRGANFRHLLVNSADLNALGIPCIKVERGGDITYHGPGQLVAYPILDLHGYGRDVHAYVRRLEATARLLLRSFGVQCETRAGQPGLYVGTFKLASIGVFVGGWVTMHGVAINLSHTAGHMELLTPCGLKGTTLGSVEMITGMAPTYEEAARRYAKVFQMVFGCRLEAGDASS